MRIAALSALSFCIVIGLANSSGCKKSVGSSGVCDNARDCEPLPFPGSDSKNAAKELRFLGKARHARPCPGHDDKRLFFHAFAKSLKMLSAFRGKKEPAR